MIHHGIHAALARERMSTFLAQAEAGRLARQARRRPKGGRVWLRDGSAVLIRPVRPADDGLWRYFTDVDHHDHEALGALDHARGGGVGIARYIRDRDDPHTADNAAMAGLLQNFGGDLVRREFGTVEYEIELSCRVTRPLRTA